MPTKTLMIQGTASHVGKSLIAAAFCRIFRKRGLRVAPFKAQNMSNNSFVTASGGEIGRAQAVQAEACGIEPSVLMNPVLLKPSSERKCQVVVMGEPVCTLSAREYESYKLGLVPVVDQALAELMAAYEMVVIEGAGSPAEVNLKERDIANMRIARRAGASVLLVGDIDKGGVFAQLAGTFDLLEPEERDRIRGFLINKFRGDPEILKPGLEWIEARTHRKVLGVLPFVRGIEIPEEDAVLLDERRALPQSDGRGSEFVSRNQKLLIQVIRLPRISNFTDFDALAREPDVTLEYLDRPDRHSLADLLVIPGSKATVADLHFLRRAGFASHISSSVKAGVPVLGICGGFQMLGEAILDPEKVEARESRTAGLGLLPTITTFRRHKTTFQVKAIHLESELEVQGYEIHMGRTEPRDGAAPLFKIVERKGVPVEDYDGLCVRGGHSAQETYVLGTYLHGLFDQAPFRRYFLNKIRRLRGLDPWRAEEPPLPLTSIDVYDRWANVVESHVDMKQFADILEEPVR